MSKFTLQFPDGETVTFDACTRWNLAVSFEFQPDAPPEITSAAIGLHAWEDETFLCGVDLSLGTVCEPGFYRMPGDATAEWATTHCSGLSDQNEGEFGGFDGWVWLQRVETGAAVGNFEGDLLRTTLGGQVWAQAWSGAVLTGSFTISEAVEAGASQDGEACAVVEGDLDGDGHPGAELGGSDCDDTDPAVNDAADEACDDIDNDCDGEIDEAGDPRYLYRDGDGDGSGAGEPVAQCARPPGDWSRDGNDCDDDSANLHPYDSDGDGSLDACGWKSVDSDFFASCSVDSDGEVSCWGVSPPTGAPAGPFVEVRTGYEHACGIPESGGVVCWGTDTYGQVVSLTDTPLQLELGHSNTCILDSVGELSCWGANDGGQTEVPAGSFEQMSMGATHGCAVDAAGDVTCWRLDTAGETTPDSGSFVRVEAGWDHSCGITTTGGVACWGGNDYFQAYDLPGLEALDLDAGRWTTGVIDAWGTLYAGGADYGAGEYDFTDTSRSDFIAVESTYKTTIGMREDGGMECRGRYCP